MIVLNLRFYKHLALKIDFKIQIKEKNMACFGIGGAFLKTSFELQEENPEDDIQIAKLLSKIATIKR